MDLEAGQDQMDSVKKSMAKKKWEVFLGNNIFRCDGLLMFGEDAYIFYLCVFLGFLTLGMFLVFDGPYLAHHISPALPVISVVLCIFIFPNLIKASLTDPGIIPRSTKAEADLLKHEIEQLNKSYTIEVNGHTVNLKYCYTCKIIRPPRASHCRKCDNCVEMFDHHCPFIGNCIGRRNYRYFYWYMVAMTIDTGFVFLCSFFHLYLLSKDEQGDKNPSFLNAITQSPASLIVCIVSFCSTMFTLSQVCTFSCLALCNLTTHEFLKMDWICDVEDPRYDKRQSYPCCKGNPFFNCAKLLCGPRPPSLIDARELVSDVTNSDCESVSRWSWETSSTSGNEFKLGSQRDSPPAFNELSPRLEDLLPRSLNESFIRTESEFRPKSKSRLSTYSKNESLASSKKKSSSISPEVWPGTTNEVV